MNQYAETVAETDTREITKRERKIKTRATRRKSRIDLRNYLDGDYDDYDALERD